MPNILEADIHVGLPCHHPAWPRRCDACGQLADGFHVSQILGDHDGQRFAYGLAAVACRPCRRVVLSAPPPVPAAVHLPRFEQAVRTSSFFSGMRIAWMGAEEFDRRCRVTPELVESGTDRPGPV